MKASPERTDQAGLAPGPWREPAEAPSQEAPPAPAAPPPARPATRVVAAALGVGYLLHVAWRLLLAQPRSGPLVIADEIGYLINARVLTGGVPGDLSYGAFYRGGYSLLIAPAFWLAQDPVRVYQAVLVVNALVSSAVFPLLYLFLRRVLGTGRAPALAAALVAAAYPPLVLNSLLAWSESLLAPLVLAWLLTLHGLLGSPGLRSGWPWAVGGGVAAGWLYTTHGRAAPLLALQTLLLAAVAVRRRQARWLAVVATAVTAVALVAGNELNQYLARASWGGSAGGELGRMTNALGTPRGWANMVAVTAGQWWYTAIGSLGLAAVGAGVLALLAVRPLAGRLRLPWLDPERPGPPLPAASALVAGLLLASWLGLALLVGAFLFPPARPDHLVYGRYVDPLAPPLLAVGLVGLAGWWRSRSLPARLSGLVAACVLPLVVVLAYAGTSLFEAIGDNYNDLALPFLARSTTALQPARATLFALALALLAVAAGSLGRHLPAAAVLAVFLVSSHFTTGHLFADTSQRIYGAAGWASLREAADLGADGPVGYDLSQRHPVGLFAYQYALPEARFVLVRERRELPGGLTLVFSSPEWPEATRAGARIVWRDPERSQALWRWPAPAEQQAVGG